MEYASRGVGNSALGLGIAGTALGVLNSGIGNLFGGTMAAAPACSENTCVNRYEMTMSQELAAKDGEIALLKADKYTDQKIVEAYKDLAGQINEIKEAQNAINLQQAVYNGTNTATLTCMQQQIASLQSLTKLVVPNTSVCPGWGNVTITPATTTTTTPAA